MKKYKLTSETKVIDGAELHRIKALKSFGNVEKGELGGWIESEKNLSQDGYAWVYDNAIICENARVDGHAMVYGNARVDGNVTVGDYAMVCGDATVGEKARVDGHAIVGGNATVGGHATVGDYAMVGGHATIGGEATIYWNATISGDAKVGGEEDFIVFKNWWSSGRYFTWTRSNNKWKVGCFYGSGEELIAKAYKDSEKSGREYERVVRYVESILKEENYKENRDKC